MKKIEEMKVTFNDLPKTEISVYSNKPKDLSYSIYVDSKKHMRHHRRKIKRWVSDSSVTKCYNSNTCNTEFSMFYRKHHCRVCGKIFCYYCANTYITIPYEMIEDLPKSEVELNSTGGNRVCEKCNLEVYEFNKFYQYVKQRICNFDLLELKKFTDTEKEGPQMKAVRYCLNKLRSIQYKLPVEILSILEKDLLKTNQKYFTGHSKWQIQLIKCGEPEKNKKHLNCWDTMCTRNCNQKIELSEIIDVLSHTKLTSEIIKCIVDSQCEETILFLPVISYYLNNDLLSKLIQKYKDNDVFMSELYWCVTLYSKNNTFLTHFDKEMEKLPIMTKVKKMNCLINNPKSEDITITPIEPNVEYRRLQTHNIKIIDSASKPSILPFERQDGTIKNILFKKEDLRKDHIVSNLINFACTKLKKAGIFANVTTYKVSPLTKNSGLIEIVEDSTTVFNITQNLGFTVQNYINEFNPDEKSIDITDRFMKSTSVYCIISYLLGFGDRHLDNIMITKSGLLFHVDFSYILGKDPKYNNSKNIKISPEIINVIGGYNSKNYNQFKKYCIAIYNELRMHINAFVNMLLLLPDIDNSFTEEYIINQLISRFEVGETSLEAALHMDTRIVKTSYTLTDKIIDVLYKSKKKVMSFVG